MSLTEPLKKMPKSSVLLNLTMPLNSTPYEKKEPSISLTGKKKISVQEYMGKTLIHIREYYELNGETLPGKKGIALSTADWKLLKENLSEIDGQVAHYQR